MPTLSEVIPKVDQIMQELKTCDDFTTDKVSEYMYTISDYLYPWEHAEELSEHMTEVGFANVFPLMWKALYEHFETLKEEGQGIDIFHSMLSNFTNLSDNCPAMGIALGNCGAISLLFQALKYMVSIHVRVSQKETFIDMTASFLSILHNSIRFSNHNRTLYRECDAIAILKSCLDVPIQLWKLFALMNLAYVANDSESGLLTSSEQSIHVLTGILKSAVTEDTHKDSIGDSVFSVFETLDAINHLAINDGNKLAISKDNIIPVLVKILIEEEFSLEERRVAVEALWNLAFIDSIRTSEEMQNAIPTLKELLKTEDKDLKGACESALFQIQGDQGNKTPHLTSLETPPSQPPSYLEAISEPNQANPTQNKIQIMVSYQWDSQPRAIQIRDKILNAGYQVWMDITNMRGNLLSGMAEAVQMSDIILLCMTERYKDSKSCRSAVPYLTMWVLQYSNTVKLNLKAFEDGRPEAAYAYKLEKNIIPLLLEEGYVPDGWLGLIQGMELYYAFYCDEHVRTNMGELLHAIKNCLNLPPGDEIDGTSPVTSPKQEIVEYVALSGDKGDCKPQEPSGESSHQPSSGKPRPDAIRNWTKKDVKDWLRESDVGDLCSCLSFCDGKHLEMLYKQYQANDESFKAELKSDYKMTGPQCLQFMVALNRLFEDQCVTEPTDVVPNSKTDRTRSKLCIVT